MRAWNWHLGWSMICLELFSGAVLGLKFHREEFRDGYSNFRRRMCRLEHIAIVALDMLNLLFVAITLPFRAWYRQAAAIDWLGGKLSMREVCFLRAWLPAWRDAFFLPVGALVTVAMLSLIGGPP